VTQTGLLEVGGAPVPGDFKSNSELEFLTAIERGEVVTQMSLRRRIGVSIGLINALVKRGMRNGYVKARKVPFKRYAYYVTPKGFSEKSRLVAVYLENSLAFFRGARNEYADIFARARTDGRSRLVLVGSGDLAEIAILAAWGEGLTLLGLLDSEINRDQHYGVRVIRSLEEVGPCDAVVITESRTPQQSYEHMCERLPEAQVLVPPFLKITRDRANLIAAAQKAEQS
jgi:DNA-binding MarR family transcriptional regulator